MIKRFTLLILVEQFFQIRKNGNGKKHEFSVGNDILIPYLQKEGIKKIDKLIITHGDADHIGAAQQLLSNITVKEVVFGRKEQDAELEKIVKKQALEKKVKIREVREGRKLEHKWSGIFRISANREGEQ